MFCHVVSDTGHEGLRNRDGFFGNEKGNRTEVFILSVNRMQERFRIGTPVAFYDLRTIHREPSPDPYRPVPNRY